MPDQRYSFDARFGVLIRSHGIATIPAALFEYQGELGISAQEAWLICVLLAHKWDRRAPYPSIHRLATRSKIPRSTILTYLKLLKQKGLVETVERFTTEGRQTSSSFSFDGLFARLEQLILADEGAGDSPEGSTHATPKGRPVDRDGRMDRHEVEPGEEDSDEEEMSRDELRARRLGHRIADRFGMPSRRDALARMVADYARDRDPATVERAVALTLAAWGSEDGDEAEFWRRVGRKLT